MAKKKAKRTMDPLEEALNAQEKLAAQRKAEDVQLWQQWKANPAPETLQPIMRRFEPVFRSAVQQYKAPQVSETAIRTNMQLQTLNALETYNPDRAALRTHVSNHLRKVMRFNAQHQNNTYIPEGQAAYIGGIDRAADELRQELGVDPSHGQIASFINQRPELLGGKKPLTARNVAGIQGSRRKDIIGSTMESDPAPSAASRNEAVLGLLRPALRPSAQPVFDHIYGFNGAPKITQTSVLAKRLDRSQSQISREKTHIIEKYKKYT